MSPESKVVLSWPLHGLLERMLFKQSLPAQPGREVTCPLAEKNLTLRLGCAHAC